MTSYQYCLLHDYALVSCTYTLRITDDSAIKIRSLIFFNHSNVLKIIFDSGFRLSIWDFFYHY